MIRACMCKMLWGVLFLFILLDWKCSLNAQNAKPTLTGFRYEHSYGLMVLTFDQLILASSIDTTRIHLSAEPPGLGSPVLNFTFSTPFNNMHEQGNTTTPFFYLRTDDYARLLYLNPIFGSRANKTYISMEGGAFQNYYKVPMANATYGGFEATEYLPDTLNPYILGWSLDMNVGHLTLSFSEPVRSLVGGRSDINFALNPIGIQSVSHIEYTTNNPKYVQLIDSGEETLVNATSYNRVITMSIGRTNLNRIKQGSVVGRSRETSWFSLLTPNVRDVAGNVVALSGVDFYQAVAVTSYTPDTNKPYLLKWDYDVYYGKLKLSFSEVIKATSFNYSAVTISSHQSTNTTRTLIRFDDASMYREKQVIDSDLFVIRMSVAFYNQMLDRQTILTGVGNSFLAIGEGVAWDTSERQNKYFDTTTSIDNARQVTSYIPDLVRPTIISVSLNMTSKVIIFGFDKTVRASSMLLSKLTLQNAINGGDESIIFSSLYGTVVIPALDSPLVTVGLTAKAFNALKSSNSLGLSFWKTFVAFTFDFVLDKAFNPNKIVAVVTGNAFQVTAYTADSVAPYLISWYADMNEDRIVLEFSEPIDQSILDVSAIKLYSDSDTSLQSTFMVQLWEATIFKVDATVITLQLSRAESIAVKTASPLCTQRITCLLSHTAALGKDTTSYDNGKARASSIVPTVTMLSSTGYVPDQKGPQLLSYTLNMNVGEINFEFTEPVNTAAADTSAITLYQNNSILGPNQVNISQSTYVTLSDGVFLTIKLSLDDYISIKQNGIGANGTDDVYMSVDSNFLTDVAGNPSNGSVVPYQRLIRQNRIIDISEPIRVINDAMHASIVAVYRYAAPQNLTIHFDDVIDVTTVNLAAFYLFNKATNAKYSLATAELATKNNSARLDINLHNTWRALQILDIAQTPAATSVYLSSATAYMDSPNHNPNHVLPASSSVGEGQQFREFRIDLARRKLLITLAIPIEWGSWGPAKVNLYSKTSQVNFPLTSLETISFMNNNMTLVIQLHADTLSSITTVMSVTDKDTLALDVTQDAFLDARGIKLGNSFHLSCTQIMIDTTPPAVDSFNLNLDAGFIEIYFSKPVVTATVAVAALSLINHNTAITTTISLATATLVVSSQVQTKIVIRISEGSYPTIRDLIHESGTVGVSTGQTKLVIEKGFVADTTEPPQYMVFVDAASATSASGIVRDSTPPRVVSWTIDMNSRMLNVTFDEAVQHSTNQASYYLLLRDLEDPLSAQRYLLTSTTPQRTGNTVTILISSVDINAVNIQQRQLCIDATTCYLSIKANSIEDISTNANKCAGLLFKYAAQVSTYIRDVTPPRLTGYEFSLQTGELWMHFDEIIDCDLVDITKFTWQYAQYLGISSQYFVLGTSAPICTRYTGKFTKDIYFQLDFYDWIGIKAITQLMKTRSTTFLSKGAGGITDVFGIEFADIIDGYAIQADTFTPDTDRPNLISYTITSSRMLVLYFDEPMLTTALQTSQIQFQSSLPVYSNSYFLTGASLNTADVYKMRLEVALLGDYSRISGDSVIFSSQASTFMAIGDTALTDTSGNLLLGVPETIAKPLGPSLIAWDVDLDTAKMTVEFNEAVTGAFTLAGVQVQSDRIRNSSTVFITLTSAGTMTPLNAFGTLFVTDLTLTDINLLKFNGLVKHLFAAYLHVPFGLTSSTVASTLVPYLNTVEIFSNLALKIRGLVIDTTPPDISSFGVDFNLGKLKLVFNEPIVYSTFEPTALTVIASSGASSVVITGATLVTLVDFTTIVVDMLPADFNNMKIAEARGHLDTMIISYQAAEDYFGNYYAGNTELNPVPEANSTPDNIPPTLVSATLDLKKGTLALYFDEVIDVSVMLPSHITLMSSSDGLGSTFTLTKYSVMELQQDGSVVLDMKTFRDDWKSFKVVGGIGTTLANSYVRYSSISDVFGNVMTAPAVLQVSTITPDDEPLQLVAFRSEDLTTSIRLEFTFNKFADLGTFSCNDLQLLSQNNIAGLTVGVSLLQLTESACTLQTTGSFADVVSVTVDPTFFTGTAGFGAFMWVYTISSGFVTTDSYSNKLTSAVDPIEIGPRVRDWFIDMNSGKITFGFTSEVTVAAAFNSTNLGFYSATSQKSVYMWTSPTNLSPAFGDSPANDVLGVLTLSGTDLNRLKEIDVSATTIYLLVRDGMLLGTLGTSIVNIQPVHAKIPAKFFVDNARPTLVSSTVKLGLGSIELVFSEPIRASSVQIKQIRIQSNSLSLANSITLAGSLNPPTSVGNVLTLELLKDDVARLVLRANLAENATSTFFSFASGTAKDYAGNILSAIPSNNARQVTTYVADSVAPILNSFDLDMTAGRISLHFSEAVRASLVDPTSITLMARADSAYGNFFTLTGGTIMDPDGGDVRIQLTDLDIVALKNSSGLVRNSASSFLLASTTLAEDMLGNPLVPIVNTRGKSVDVFTVDIIAPTILSIDIDVNAETITFHTSELAWINKVDASGITIQDHASAPNNSYTFSRTTKVHNPANLLFTDHVKLNIAPNDLDHIKYKTPLLKDNVNTFLAVNPVLLTDVYSNQVAFISSTAAHQVDVLVKDVTPPAMVVFEMDMANGIAYLTWDESVRFASINATQLTLQTHQHRAYGAHIFVGDSVVTSDSGIGSRTTTFALSADTMSYMKVNGICKTIFTCYVSWTDKFLQDQFYNYAVPVWDSSVLGFFPLLTNKVYDASNIHVGYLYATDSVAPKCIRWQIDRIAGSIIFHFDEPVVVIDLALITFYSSHTMENPQVLAPLAESSVLSELSRKLVVTLYKPVCTEEIKTQCVPAAFSEGVKASAGGSYWLSMKEGAMQDLAALPRFSAEIAPLAVSVLQEAVPSCVPCAAGEYIKQACTHNSDRVCAKCTTCAQGKYTEEVCTTTQDVRCKECGTCRLGQYISSQCSDVNGNTQCAICSSCGIDEFVTQKCEMGLDTVCDTCKSCFLTSTYAKLICDAKGNYKWWYEKNCCFDKDGVKVSCESLDLNNMNIARRNARHHWVFPDASVDASLYGFGGAY